MALNSYVYNLLYSKIEPKNNHTTVLNFKLYINEFLASFNGIVLWASFTVQTEAENHGAGERLFQVTYTPPDVEADAKNWKKVKLGKEGKTEKDLMLSVVFIHL